MTQRYATYLSIPVIGSIDPIITRISKHCTIEEAREDALDAGMESFVAAGYEDAEVVDATLYQIAPNGGLAHSEQFTISGPEAN